MRDKAFIEGKSLERIHVIDTTGRGASPDVKSVFAGAEFCVFPVCVV